MQKLNWSHRACVTDSFKSYAHIPLEMMKTEVKEMTQ